MRRKWGRTEPAEDTGDDSDGQTESEQTEPASPLTTYEADLEREDGR